MNAGFVSPESEMVVGARFERSLNAISHVVVLIPNGAEHDVAEGFGRADFIRRFRPLGRENPLPRQRLVWRRAGEQDADKAVIAQNA